MSVLPVASDDTDDLFAKADGQGEGESARHRLGQSARPKGYYSVRH